MDKKQDTCVKELSPEEENQEPVGDMLQQESKTPLFLKDGSEGQKGNAQDEKDKVEE